LDAIHSCSKIKPFRCGGIDVEDEVRTRREFEWDCAVVLEANMHANCTADLLPRNRAYEGMKIRWLGSCCCGDGCKAYSKANQVVGELHR
jgi:hypothetical protein